MSSENPASHQNTVRSGESVAVGQQQITIHVTAPELTSRPPGRPARILLSLSLLLNFWLLLGSGMSTSSAIPEAFLEGTQGAAARLAVISVSGMISPPFTERWIKQIRAAAADDSVRGVILAIDSPGGFVADSHQLHHEIELLAAKKTVFVSMKRLAASGGYYIAVAAGPSARIFAEPTTWTGSIGVIIARYNARQLAETIGVRVEPLTTGPLKDTLNPFRDMTPQETAVWDAILKDSFDRFVSVIDNGRSQLDDAAVRALATGQIYTAKQALDNHLVDALGYQEDVVKALAEQLQLTQYEVFEYRSTPGLVDVLLGATARQPSLSEQFAASTVPQAMYFASWNPLPLLQPAQ
jgi:protease-4